MIDHENVPLTLCLVVVLVNMVLLVVLAASASAMIPRCAEDTVLVGVGEYQGGRWSGYECGPALDDFGFGFGYGDLNDYRRFDVNRDGAVDVLDVQAVVNAFLAEG